MKQAFVTGAAGFIGSHLVDKLLSKNISVVGWDNFSTGRIEFLAGALDNPAFTLNRGDNLDIESLKNAMRGSDFVFHFAANADVRFGTEHPKKDLEQNTIATFNVLEAMRFNKITRIAFPSTGSVYGEADVIPTPETAPFPVQTSLYGASKLACEGLIAAYCEGFKFDGYCFRFVSILGERYTHGHVFDFYKQLLAHPDSLKLLGDGSQRKSYMYVQDCVDAIFHIIDRNEASNSKHRFVVTNLGTNEFCLVKDSIGWICKELNLDPKLEFGEGNKGWIGDNPFIFLDIGKLIKSGFSPKLNIESGIKKTLQWLAQNHWVLENRL